MNRYILVLILITLIGVFLRTYDINGKEFWYDEAFTAKLVQNSFPDITEMTLKDVHPPLYYYTVKVWTSVFGTSDLGFRSLSVVFGVLLIPLTYWLCLSLQTSKLSAILITAGLAVMV